MVTGLPVFKTLIEYNSNHLEENYEEDKVATNKEFTEQNADTGYDKNSIEIRWSNVQGKDEEIIAKANLIENL